MSTEWVTTASSFHDICIEIARDGKRERIVALEGGSVTR